MPKKSVTIRDVARLAGVSVATASRALNGKQVVHPETRDRILAVMEELGFAPSPAARRLSLGRTLTVGVVVSFLTRPQAAERIRGVDAVLADSEFDLVIYNVESVQKRDHYLGTLAQSQRTDGLLVMSLPPSSDAVCRPRPGPGSGRLHRRPHAICRRHAAGHRRRRRRRRACCATSAEARSSRDRIHRRCRRSPFGFTSSTDREAGFTRELSSAGVTIPPQWVGHGAHGRYEARALAGRMLNERGPADGDLRGQRYPGPRRHRSRERGRTACPRRRVGHRLRRHRGRGLRRPDDRPPAAVRIRAARGRDPPRARSITGPTEPPVVQLAPELVVRATTAPPKEGR